MIIMMIVLMMMHRAQFLGNVLYVQYIRIEAYKILTNVHLYLFMRPDESFSASYFYSSRSLISVFKRIADSPVQDIRA